MAGSPCWFPALLLLLPLPPPALPRRASGCAARGLCCPGRDAACLSTGRRPDGSTGPCYCDQACARTLDCCHDYAQACTVIPCVVSQWSAWSGCAEPCKTTYRVRMRHIIQEPRNGGEACPALEERAGCVEYWTRQGTECQQSLSTVWSSSSWPSRWAACRATTHTLAGCITSGRATPSAWSVSTRLCTPRVSIAMAMAPAAKRISCCTGRQWGTIDAREPGGEFASWTLVPVLLFTASCSSDFSWQSQQAPVCSSSRSQSNDFSVLEALLSLPFQRLQAVQGHLESSLSVCAPQFPKQSGWLGSADLFFPLRESCLTLMTSCKFPLF